MRRFPEPWAGHSLGLAVEGGGRSTARRSTPRPLPRYLAKLSSVGSISEEETCEKLKGLIQRQVQMCKRNLEVMDSVRRGAQLAIEECQYQFRNRRWNCSTLDSLPVFGKVVTQGEGGARGRWGGASPGQGRREPPVIQGAKGQGAWEQGRRAGGASLAEGAAPGVGSTPWAAALRSPFSRGRN